MNDKFSYQIVLNVIAVLMICLAVVAALTGIGFITYGAVFGQGDAAAAQDGVQLGAASIVTGILVLIAAVIDVVIGYVGFQFSKNLSKNGAFFGLCIIGLIVTGACVVAAFLEGTSTSWASLLFGFVVIVMGIWLAVNVQRQVEFDGSGFQFALSVVGMLQIIFAIIVLVLGALSLFGGAFFSGGSAALGEGSDGFGSVSGAMLLVAGVVYLIVGFLGLFAANNPSKIGIYFVFAIIGIVVAVASSIIMSMQSTNMDWLTQVIGVLMTTVGAWLASSIRKQA